jgi:hypothetical protein
MAEQKSRTRKSTAKKKPPKSKGKKKSSSSGKSKRKKDEDFVVDGEENESGDSLEEEPVKQKPLKVRKIQHVCESIELQVLLTG